MPRCASTPQGLLYTCANSHILIPRSVRPLKTVRYQWWHLQYSKVRTISWLPRCCVAHLPKCALFPVLLTYPKLYLLRCFGSWALTLRLWVQVSFEAVKFFFAGLWAGCSYPPSSKSFSVFPTGRGRVALAGACLEGLWNGREESRPMDETVWQFR